MKNSTLSEDRLFTLPFGNIVLISLLIWINTFMMVATMPMFIQELGGSNFTAGIVAGILTLTSFFTRPFLGTLLDWKGRKPILIAGIAILLAATMAYSLTVSLAVIFILRIVHGIGWSAATTATSTIAADVIPPARRTEGIGYFSIANSLGMAIGPAFGIYMVQHFGYNYLYAVAAGFLVFSLLLGSAGSYQQGDRQEKMNNQYQFMVIEKTAVVPSFIFLLIAVTYGGILTFLPLYAAYRGIPDAGLFFSMYALALLMTRTFSGRAADQMGMTKVMMPGMVFLVVALVLLVEAGSLTMLILAAVFYGFGFGLVQPALNALVITLAPPERKGRATATFFAAMDIGMGVGSIAGGGVAQIAGFTFIYSVSIGLIILAAMVYCGFVYNGSGKVADD